MRFTPLALALCLLFSFTAHAGYEWGFADASVNRLFWSKDTQKKSDKSDFNYLELEGGGQFTWGELYGFFDLENFDMNAHQMRTAEKGVARYYLGQTGFSLYGHVYEFDKAAFSDQVRVIGLGYQLTGQGWWFKPFLGINEVTQTYFTGMNGYMTGWTAGYSFKIGQHSFLLSSWHEMRFARQDTAIYQRVPVGQNGAAGIWWTYIPQITVGAQWRYAMNELGTPGYVGAGIASLKYNF